MKLTPAEQRGEWYGFKYETPYKRCNPPCKPCHMIGCSWWKCMGYGGSCGCAMDKLFKQLHHKNNKKPTREEVEDAANYKYHF